MSIRDIKKLILEHDIFCLFVFSLGVGLPLAYILAYFFPSSSCV